MEKQKVIELFGGVSATARAVGVTPAAVSKWPPRLSQRLADRVVAAALRAGLEAPPVVVDVAV